MMNGMCDIHVKVMKDTNFFEIIEFKLFEVQGKEASNLFGPHNTIGIKMSKYFAMPKVIPETLDHIFRDRLI